MSNPVLSGIYVYPIKSLGGVSLSSAVSEDRGLKYDRRWMLVDEDMNFLTQRKHPEMALIRVSIEDEGLVVTHKTKNYERLFIPFEEYDPVEIKVTVWDDECSALTVSNQADCWFSRALGMPAALVRMPDYSRRLVDRRYAEEEKIVGFADGYPFLLIGRSSLDELNGRLEHPVPMNRFRPNLVFSGAEPFAEDSWKKFRIGGTVFSCVKPCARCSITTVDQDSALQSKEPLATLASFRTFGNKVMFGQNLIHEGNGKLQLGDELEILELK